jgi:AAA domain/TrwC relaxase
VAVRTSLARGIDPHYPGRSAGKPGAQRKAGDYYWSAHQEGGEPAGRWWGPGAEALGFAKGQEIEAGPFKQVFVERVDPRDGVTPLGRKPGKREETERLVHELRKQMPHATSEELHQIRVSAAQKAHAGPLYIDMTNGFSKSISLFHASLAENARLAEAAGDQSGHAYWSAQLEAMDEMVYEAVHAGFDYFQDQAGYVRTGHHGGKVNGKPTGARERADLAVALWLQHTSRDEDPQLHVHGQILHAARTQRDGKWRAPDSAQYGKFIGAVSAITAAHLEAAMARRFGVKWVARKDGLGREVEGIAEPVMDLFSQRRNTIEKNVRAWAKEYAQAHNGRAPTQRVLTAVARREHNLTRNSKPEGKLDLRSMLADWAQRMRGAQLGDLSALARDVSALKGPGSRGPARGPGPTQAELERAARQALDLVQADKPTWTESDLIRSLGTVMTASVQQLEPAAQRPLLEDLAARALGSAFERVVALSAPATREVPAELLRDDGLSKYELPGARRYALESHLAREAALVESAQAQDAPRMSREACAAQLGASADELEAALHGRASDGAGAETRSGLRMDQAAALFYALTSDKTVAVITGPAGSGKTHVLAAAAAAWPGAVVGITPSSSSRNVLAAASGARSFNSAQFLGHLREGREMLGIYDIDPGTLILLDESSMMSLADIESIVAWARAHGSRVLMSGDQEQLEAVEGGGGMGLLAGHLGYAQLAVPVRFREQWERDASLRLRVGDASVLTEYDQQGRVIGGDPEHLLDQAARRYVAHYLTGADVLMMAMSHEDCHELSRRVRDDLIHLGLVDAGRSARLNAAAKASAGDLIIARDNANTLEAGERGRFLANGDTLKVERVNPDGSLAVRLAVDADRETGARRFAEAEFTLPPREARKADLAYAVTGHSAQGRTVAFGLAVLRGNETRGWTYVALSRAILANIALVMTTPKKADLSDVARPAPELERFDRVERLRQGLPAEAGEAPDTTTEALGVLAGNLDRVGREDAALDVLRRELAGADNLAELRVIFENETAGPRADRYAGMLREALTAADFPARVRKGHTDKWLFRTLETAELAGRDPRQVLAQAIGQGPLEGVRDVVAVIGARAKALTGPAVPQAPRPWAERVPEMGSPAMQAYIEGIAGDMDDRTARLGEHAAETAPAWALRGLGAVPEDPTERLDWTTRASALAAYREAYSYADAAEPIGPEPVVANPQQRAAWHGALAALGAVDGIDVRGMTDGALLNARAVFERETAWAPRYVADELRHVRRAATAAQLSAVRAAAEAKAAYPWTSEADTHARQAEADRAHEAWYRHAEAELNEQMESRKEWHEATDRARRTGLAADSAYRRRHPETDLSALRNQEPEPVTDDERAELDPATETDAGEYKMPSWLEHLAQQRQAAQAELDDRRSVRMPSEDPEGDYDGFAWPQFIQRERDAVIQPPKPEIRPSAAIIEAAAEREASL